MKDNFDEKVMANRVFDSLVDGLVDELDSKDEKKEKAIKYVVKQGVDIHDFYGLTTLSKQLHAKMSDMKAKIKDDEEFRKEYHEMEYVAIGILRLMLDCSDD